MFTLTGIRPVIMLGAARDVGGVAVAGATRPGPRWGYEPRPLSPCHSGVATISFTAQQKSELGQAPVAHSVTVSPATPSGNRDWYKRPFDLAILLAVHILLLPILLLLWVAIPLAIWLEDRGPIFYAQRRAGKGGRVFRLFKFRSMVPDAESSTGVVWASDDDPRITRVGRFLRSRALDELPQVINMWKGELSWVGPRPERPELVEKFACDMPAFLSRLQVRPGLTGPAQLYGRYATRPRDKLRYDALYIKRMSPWLDLKLLFMSVLVTLRAKWQANDRQL